MAPASWQGGTKTFADFLVYLHENKSMTIPTPDDCRKENCDSAEQQDARVMRRWVAEPYGRLNASWSNFQGVRLSLEFMIGRLLQLSDAPALHEYWCDGVEPVVHTSTNDDYSFAGACILADRESTAQWLAPFELQIVYPPGCDWPLMASVRLGHRDAERLFDRSLGCCREHRLYALSDWIYGARPNSREAWAICLDLDPYPPQNSRLTSSSLTRRVPRSDLG